MKLILQRTDFSIYAYFETEKHFTKVEKERLKESKRLNNPHKILGEECDLEFSLPAASHMVIDVKKGK